MNDLTPSPLLRVSQLRTGYGRMEVLKDVSLFVNPGEIVTIIGANGAGKTTTLMAISRFLPLVSGEISFNGCDLTTLRPDELVFHGIAHVPEGRKIFPRLTVLENLELGAYSRGDAAEIARSVEFATTLFPVLGQRRHQLGGTLSGGEQQMLAIARALMSKPKLLLLDEPSMGVAPLLIEKIFETITTLNKDGLPILLVEQNAHMALATAHRGYVLETGSIVAQDSAQNLLSNQKVQEAYLGASV